jgi:CHAT domain-containing protein
MRDFFAGLRGGETVPQALSDAQRKFLSARRAEGPTDFWIHPYFWAVYKSTGSDLARVAPSAETN